MVEQRREGQQARQVVQAQVAFQQQRRNRPPAGRRVEQHGGGTGRRTAGPVGFALAMWRTDQPCGVAANAQPPSGPSRRGRRGQSSAARRVRR